MPRFLLRVLGPPRVEDTGGEPVEGLTPLPLLLLAFLALSGKSQQRDHLARLLWPSSDAPKARHSLRQLLSRIRHLLPPVLVTTSTHVEIDLDWLSTDAAVMEAELRQGQVAGALTWWRGHFLEGLSRPESWEMEEWMERERARLERLLESAVADSASRLLALARATEAIDLLGTGIRALPLSEDLLFLQARALGAAGRRPEAEALLAAAEVDEEDDRLVEVRKHLRATPLSSPEVPQGSDPGIPPAGGPGHEVAEQAREVAEGSVPAGPRSLLQASPRQSKKRMVATGAALLTLPLFYLAARTAQGTEGASAPFETEIWFCSHRETEWSFRMDQDGNAKRSLSSDPVCPVIPLARGKEAIALRSGREESEVGRLVEGRFLPLTRLPGWASVSHPVRQAGPLDGVVSPDGRWLVLTLETPLDHGRRPSPVPAPGVAGAADTLAQWSLVLVDLSNGTMEEVTGEGGRNYEARFSPDGSRIIWVSERTGAGDLYSMAMGTREMTRLTSHPFPDRDPSLSNGTVAFRRGWGDGPGEGGEEIVLFDISTGEEASLTRNGWNDVGPDLGRDGTAVCWTSKEHGHWESDIMVMDLRTRVVTNATGAPGRDDYCQWHPTEPVVFFSSWRTGDNEIFRTGLRLKDPPVNLSRYAGSDEWPALVMPR